MKKVIVTLIFVIALSAFAAATVDHYKDYRDQQTASNKTTQDANSKLSAEVNNLNIVIAETKLKHNQQVVECQKGKVAYDKLSAPLKTQTQVPTCGSAL